MLENIKSSFILENIFSFMEEKTKLDIIKYNKTIQKKLNITVIYYKLLSQKYIIFEGKGKGKEYEYDGSLVFEGEYLNAKRNGKGKEYDNGRLVFEGEYLNGKKNGHGKEYNKNGYIKFEGEYLNGERHGHGQENSKYGQVKFEGDYLYGKKWNGKGYDVFNNIVYELKNGNGFSKEYYYNGQKNLKESI